MAKSGTHYVHTLTHRIAQKYSKFHVNLVYLTIFQSEIKRKTPSIHCNNIVKIRSFFAERGGFEPPNRFRRLHAFQTWFDFSVLLNFQLFINVKFIDVHIWYTKISDLTLLIVKNKLLISNHQHFAINPNYVIFSNDKIGEGFIVVGLG